MPTESALILLNNPALVANGAVNGTGSDVTAASGAVITVDEMADMVCQLTLSKPTSGTAAADTETLAVLVQASDDAGSHFNTIGTFRNVLGSELPLDPPSGTDGSTGGQPTIRLAIPVKMPKAKTGTTVQVRLRITGSDGDSWGAKCDLRGRGDTREYYMQHAGIKS